METVRSERGVQRVPAALREAGKEYIAGVDVVEGVRINRATYT